MEIRLLDPLDAADHAASSRLGSEAFGAQRRAAPPVPAEPPAGREQWGVFVGEALAAQVAAHSYASWWHGSPVATCGVAGVAVAAEHRGHGLLAPLLERALAAAAERGEVVSTLFPTAAGIYRPCGYEVVSSLDTVEVATLDLGSVRPPVATRTRRARTEDLPAIHEVYDRWAAAQNGPLTRTGPRFAGRDQLLDEVTAVTLTVDADDRVVGFASWDRGEGYDPASAVLDVHDLIATTADGYRALWRMLGSWSSVVGRVRVTSSGHDPARLVLPTSAWQVVERHPYMLRVSDPAAALTAAGLSLPGLHASTPVAFRVVGDRLGRADGSYRLVIGDGPGTCEPFPDDPSLPTFTTQGLALAYGGAQSCTNLRLLDHLTGPDDHDRLLDALLGGHPLHIRDYF